jgi:hypothetical protein
MNDTLDRFVTNFIKFCPFFLLSLVIVFFINFVWNGDASRKTEEAGVRNYVRLFALAHVGDQVGQLILMVGGWAGHRREDALLRAKEKLRKRRREADSSDDESWMEFLED